MSRPAKVTVLVGLLAAMVLSAPAAVSKPKNTPRCANGYVSLSFDDSPTSLTPALLSTLRRTDLRATFFDVGARAERYPSYVASQAGSGHAVANHTYDHPDLLAISPDAAIDQLTRTQTILRRLTGRSPSLYRPPYGSTSSELRASAERIGLTEVIWTVDTNDWAGPTAAEIAERALTVQPGGFVLMHDGYPNTIAALPAIADGLVKRGLCAGRIVASDTPTVAWEGLAFPATVAKW